MDSIKTMRNFVAAIIYQAVYDWVRNPRMKDEIRDFFQSEWGKECGEFIDLSASDILKRLENNQINIRALETEEV